MHKLLAEFRQRGREVDFKNRELILRQGSRGDCVLLLTHGFVSVVRRLPDGSGRFLAFRGPMSLLGDMSVLVGKPRNADVAALGSCKAVKVLCGDFLTLTQNIDVVRELWVREQGLREQDGLARMRLRDPLGARLARTLLYLAGNGSTARVQGLTQEILAQAVGVTRNALIPVLKGLKDAGAVAIGRGSIEIRDIRALRDLAKDPGRVRRDARQLEL